MLSTAYNDDVVTALMQRFGKCFADTRATARDCGKATPTGSGIRSYCMERKRMKASWQ